MTIILGLDFDGTVVGHEFPEIGPAIPQAIYYLRQFVSAGARIVLWTVRDGEHLAAAVAYMAEKGVELWGVNSNPEQLEWSASPKMYAHLYIDDAALGVPLVYEVLEGGRNSRPFVDWSVVGPMVLEKIRKFDAGVHSTHRPSQEQSVYVGTHPLKDIYLDHD